MASMEEQHYTESDHREAEAIAADGETFESVIYKAAGLLGVEIQ